MNPREDIKLDLSVPLFEDTEKYFNTEEVFTFLPGLLVSENLRITLVHSSLFEYLVSEEIKAKDATIQEFALDAIKARLQVADTCFRLFVQSKEAALTSKTLDKHESPSIFTALCHGLELSELIKFSNWPSSWHQLIKRVFFNADGKPDASLDETTWERIDERKLGFRLHYLMYDPMPLAFAIGAEYLELLAFFVQNGLVNWKDSIGGPYSWEPPLSALYFACRQGFSRRILDFLLSYGCDFFIPRGEYDNAFEYCIREIPGSNLTYLLKAPQALERCKEEGYSPLINVVTATYSTEASSRAALLSMIPDVPNMWQAVDRKTMPALHTAIALGRSEIVWSLLREGAKVHIKGQFFGNALQCAVVMMQTFALKELLSRGARLYPEGPKWDKIILAIGKGMIFNEGTDGGQLAVARLRLARSIFEDRDHSDDSFSCVKQFFNAAQTPDTWSRTLNVPWKELKAWKDQKMPTGAGIDGLEMYMRERILQD